MSRPRTLALAAAAALTLAGCGSSGHSSSPPAASSPSATTSTSHTSTATTQTSSSPATTTGSGSSTTASSLTGHGYTPAIVSGFQRSCNASANAQIPTSVPAAKLTRLKHAIAQYCTCALTDIEARVPAKRFVADGLAVDAGTAKVPAYAIAAEHACVPQLKAQVTAAIKG